MRLKYLFGILLSIPFIPVMLVQGRRIRKTIPDLPEAKGPRGSTDNSFGNSLRMITLGESTIAGVGVDTHEEGFSGTLAKELSSRLKKDVHWEVVARSGYTAKKVRTSLVPLIPSDPPDLIVIGLGGNDSFQRNTPWGWKKDCRDLIHSIEKRFPNTPVFFTNMPPIHDFPAFTPLIRFFLGNLVSILGNELRLLSDEYENVYYYPRRITLEDWIERLHIEAEPEDFFSDGVHPSLLTYQTWAGDFSEFVEKNY